MKTKTKITTIFTKTLNNFWSSILTRQHRSHVYIYIKDSTHTEGPFRKYITVLGGVGAVSESVTNYCDNGGGGGTFVIPVTSHRYSLRAVKTIINFERGAPSGESLRKCNVTRSLVSDFTPRGRPWIFPPKNIPGIPLKISRFSKSIPNIPKIFQIFHKILYTMYTKNMSGRPLALPP